MKDNILIAEFMGLAHQLGMYGHPLSGEYVYPENLEYHNNWSLLMPVVEKIEGLFACDRFEIGQNQIYVWAETPKEQKCRIEFSYGKIRNPDFNTKIEAVYNTIVDFIKWYSLTEN